MQLKGTDVPGEIAIHIKQIIIFSNGKNIAVYFVFASGQMVELHRQTILMKEKFKSYIKNLANGLIGLYCSEGFQLERFYTNVSDKITERKHITSSVEEDYHTSLFYATVNNVKFRVGYSQYKNESWVFSYNIHSYNSVKPPPLWKFSKLTDEEIRNKALFIINLLISISN
jgi:hypothetical protein